MGRRNPSCLRVATAGLNHIGPATESPFTSTQYQFMASEASAYEEMASPQFDALAWSKKTDIQLERILNPQSDEDLAFDASGSEKQDQSSETSESTERSDSESSTRQVPPKRRATRRRTYTQEHQ